MTRGVDDFLAALERLPAVALEVDEPAGSASVRVGTHPVARVDLWSGHVLVSVPPDRIGALGRIFPSSRPAADGIVFDVADARSAAEALAAIRRRVIVERSIPQLRLSSP